MRIAFRPFMLVVTVLFICRAPQAAAQPFIQIIESGDVDAAKKYLSEHPESIVERDSHEMTPLHIVACYGPIELVIVLVEAGADLDAVAYNTFTPLHVATSKQAAAELLKAGANPRLRDSWGKTPFQNAVQMRKQGVMDAFLESGYELDLASALRLEKYDIAKKLLEANPSLANPQAGSDLWGNTLPLGIVASQGNAEMVRLLIEYGADVNAGTRMPNAGGEATAISNAVWAGHTEIVRILLENGARAEGVGGKFFSSIFDYAIQHSDPEIVELLLRHETLDERFVFSYRESALLVACRDGKLEIVKLLLQYAGDRFTSEDHRRGLLLAARYGHDELIGFWLAEGVEPDIVILTTMGDVAAVRKLLDTDDSLVHTRDHALGCTLLGWSVRQGNLEMAQMLIDASADVSDEHERSYSDEVLLQAVTPPEFESIGGSATIQETPLSLTLKLDDTAITALLLKHGAEVSKPVGFDRRLPLHAAVMDRNVDLVRILLDAGADVDASGGRWGNALVMSCDSVELTKLLIAFGADVNHDSGFGTALQGASSRNPEVAQVLIANGAQVDFVSAIMLGMTEIVEQAIKADPELATRPIGQRRMRRPILIAASCGHLEVVRLLLDAGADVEGAANVDDTPLQLAAYEGSAAVVSLLLERGADISVSSPGGTPLYHAAQFGHLEVLKVLVANGIDVAAPSGTRGLPPLHAVAWWSNDAEVAEFLIANGADPNLTLERDGQSPLHMTPYHGTTAVAEVLLRHGADINAMDHKGMTPLAHAMRAAERGDLDDRERMAKWAAFLESRGGVR